MATKPFFPSTGGEPFEVAGGLNELQRQEIERLAPSAPAWAQTSNLINRVENIFRTETKLYNPAPIAPPPSNTPRRGIFRQPALTISPSGTIDLPPSQEEVDLLNPEITPALPLIPNETAEEIQRTSVWQRMNGIRREQAGLPGNVGPSPEYVQPGIPSIIATDTDLSEINNPAQPPPQSLLDRLIRWVPGVPGFNPNLPSPFSQEGLNPIPIPSGPPFNPPLPQNPIIPSRPPQTPISPLGPPQPTTTPSVVPF